MVNGFTIKAFAFTATLLTFSAPLYAAQHAPLSVGMTREQVLDVRGAPHSKVEMETARIEKWRFSYHEILVFKEGKLIGTQEPRPPYVALSTQRTKPAPKVSISTQKGKRSMFDSTAIFKEIEGISEPDGVSSLAPSGISQSSRPMTAPHPAREVDGTDSEE